MLSVHIVVIEHRLGNIHEVCIVCINTCNPNIWSLISSVSGYIDVCMFIWYICARCPYCRDSAPLLQYSPPVYRIYKYIYIYIHIYIHIYTYIYTYMYIFFSMHVSIVHCIGMYIDVCMFMWYISAIACARCPYCRHSAPPLQYSPFVY